MKGKYTKSNGLCDDYHTRERRKTTTRHSMFLRHNIVDTISEETLVWENVNYQDVEGRDF